MFQVLKCNSFSSVGFHCIQVVKKTENIFYIKIGRLSPNNEDACHTQLFFDNTIPTTTITSKKNIAYKKRMRQWSMKIFLIQFFFLLAAHLHASICPLTGNYALRNKNISSNCSNQVTLSSGCHNSHKMKLTTICPKDIKGIAQFNKIFINYSSSFIPI